jgi:hypothetical protein
MNTNHPERGHLTEKEISEWLVEGPEQSPSLHVENCWACQAKVTEARESLAAFRTAVVEWSEARAARPSNLKVSEKRNQGHGARRHEGLRLWLPVAGFAATVLLILGYAGVPALLHRHSDAHLAVVTASLATDSDQALLDQVDTEVSEAVPDAMAPLTDLVAWDSTERATTATAGKAATTETAAKHPAHQAPPKAVSAKAQVKAEN